MLLQSELDIEVMNVAANGKELLHLLHNNDNPNLVLLDINMPGINGFEALKKIKAYYPKVKVIMLSTYNEEHLIEKAKTEGANGYLFKNAEKEELLRVMRRVNDGNYVSLKKRRQLIRRLMIRILF